MLVVDGVKIGKEKEGKRKRKSLQGEMTNYVGSDSTVCWNFRRIFIMFFLSDTNGHPSALRIPCRNPCRIPICGPRLTLPVNLSVIL